MRSPNVSVTPINVPGHGEPLDSSDAEVAQIDFQSSVSVNMRHKIKRECTPSGIATSTSTNTEIVPRPMSWEGELSDGDNDENDENKLDMCVDDDTHSHLLPENLSMHHHTLERQSSITSADSSKESPIMRLKQSHSASYSLHSTPSNSPLLSQRHPLPSMVPKDLVHKALNVPPTPSPDSAVHSAYSVFSSPTQSPLTQRHVTLTPNLSRNNSDASHSSCCSYSSVSVSVSPTQQFSPTHSPIQGRHMPNIHSSPLHHNVLYRSLQDDSNTQFTTSSASEQDNDDNIVDDKTLIHSSLPAQPGISRQQLINR